MNNTTDILSNGTSSSISSNEDNPGAIVVIIASILTFLGSLVIVLSQCCFNKLRNFAFKLVFYLAISSMILSAGNIVTIRFSRDDESLGICIVQALVINFGGLSSAAWTAVIAYTLYLTVVKASKNVTQNLCWYVPLGFGLPAVLSIIPASLSKLGKPGYSCWNDQNDDDDTSERIAGIIVALEFYLPILIIAIFNIYIHFRIVKTLKNYVDTSLEKRFVSRLQYYPLMVAVCWTFAILVKVIALFGKQNDLVDNLALALGTLQGFLNAIIYVLTPSVRTTFTKSCCRCCVVLFKRSSSEPENLRLPTNPEEKDAKLEIDMKQLNNINVSQDSVR